jgi:hypothetical protein
MVCTAPGGVLRGVWDRVPGVLRWQRVTIPFAAVCAALALLGCGSGGGSTSKDEGGDAATEMRRVCLEGREGISGIPPVMRSECKGLGVTATSPPVTSPEAEKARQHSEQQSAAYEQKENERPVFEKQARISALLTLQEGNRAEAEAKLEEGCPKADADELSNAWWELRRIASGPEAGSVKQLQGELDELCPL